MLMHGYLAGENWAVKPQEEGCLHFDVGEKRNTLELVVGFLEHCCTRECVLADDQRQDAFAEVVFGDSSGVSMDVGLSVPHYISRFHLMSCSSPRSQRTRSFSSRTRYALTLRTACEKLFSAPVEETVGQDED
ncbi:uncharacterized protein LOC143512038 isoform X2 [Brachyhypopomus gauderio]|uniref:uncharacterized protein LOC143512038 isoform X2 n=1 Tax=Brachyhypopomus gauderio TaxID=698409 RepID=UPI004042FDC4